MSKEILLTRGAVAIVDDDDYDRLVAMGRWHLSDMGYAVRRTPIDGKNRTIRMHRVVNKTPDYLVTDHINRNRLDNRKVNLRSVTQQVNMLNVDRGLGVWYQKQNNNWIVEIQNMHVGVFEQKELALQIAFSIRAGDLPLTRIKVYNPFCKRGHDKRVVKTYGNSCRECVKASQKEYYRRKRSQHDWTA